MSSDFFVVSSGDPASSMNACPLHLVRIKQIFRQAFGDSIYNYYQSERMSHAAQLLKEYSVSEAGYHIGFSNLSHFTRVFERFDHKDTQRAKLFGKRLRKSDHG
jgi:transcriptional regulator GlxA family with amidase domain